MKSKTERTTSGNVSVEQLHHFRCDACDKWWSIGDPQIIGIVEDRLWFCPWCGAKQYCKTKKAG